MALMRRDGGGGLMSGRTGIRIAIDELVLTGFAPAQGAAVAAAAREHLGRLLAQRGLPGALRSDGALDRLGANALRVSAGTPPARLGRQIAGAVYGAMDRTAKREGGWP